MMMFYSKLARPRPDQVSGDHLRIRNGHFVLRLSRAAARPSFVMRSRSYRKDPRGLPFLRRATSALASGLVATLSTIAFALPPPPGSTASWSGDARRLTCAEPSAAECRSSAYAGSACGRQHWNDHITGLSALSCLNHCAPPAGGADCGVARPDNCSDPSYRDSICGQLEWEACQGETQWRCIEAIADELQSNTEPTMLPQTEITASGIVHNGIAATTARRYPAPEVQRHIGYDPDFRTASMLPSRIAYADAAVSSCEEVVFESFWDYAVWHERFLLGSADLEGALDHAFTALFDPSTGQSNMTDTAGQPLPTVNFPTAVWDSLLTYWDRARSRPALNAPRNHMTHLHGAAWHAYRWNLAKARGWPIEYMEELRRLQQLLAQGTAHWNMLMRQTIDEVARYKAIMDGDKWLAALEDIAQQLGGPDFVHWVWQLETMAATHSNVAHLHGLERDWTFDWDAVEKPHAGWNHEFPETAFLVLPPPEERLGETLNADLTYNTIPDLFDPNLTALEFAINSDPYVGFMAFASNIAAGGSRLEALIQDINAKASDLAQELDALYDMLAPICNQNPSPCTWAPSLFFTELENRMAVEMDRVMSQCIANTGNVFDQSYLNDAVFAQPFIPDDWDGQGALGSQQFHARDYGANLTAYRRLSGDKSQYDQIRTAYFTRLLKAAIGEIRDNSMIDPATGKPAKTVSQSYAESDGNSLFGTAAHQMNRSGMSTRIPDARTQGLTRDEYCELFPEQSSDFSLAVKVLGNNIDVLAVRSDLGLRITGSQQFPEYDTEGDGLMNVIGFTGWGFEYRNGSLSGQVTFDIAKMLGSSSKMTLVETPTVPVLTLGPVKVELKAGVVAKLKLSLTLQALLSSQLSACESERNMTVTVATGLDVEAFAEAALRAAILRVGVRGSLLLFGTTLKYTFGSRTVPTDLASAPPSFHALYQCSEQSGVWTCVNGAGYQQLIEQRFSYEKEFAIRFLGGRISVFAEVSLAPLPFTLGAEMDLVRWPGWGGRAKIEDGTLIRINEDLWLNPCLFGTGVCTL